MKNLTKLLGIAAIGAVLVMGMTGCDNGGGDDDDKGLNLPPITEETKGRPTIAGESIPLEAGQGFSDDGVTQAFVDSLNLPGETNQNGVTWSVTNGKLMLSLGTPGQTSPLNEVAGSMGAWTNVQISPADVAVYMVDGFEFYTEKTNGNNWERIHYNVAREKSESDGKTYYRSSQIIYVYVSKDVTASGQKGTDEDKDGHITTYNAFNYSLKEGWNLIQMDNYETPNSETRSIGIAAKNIPWTVNETGSSSGNGPA
jgi:hypothetical protein